jgi:hypothetical protein
MSLVRQVDGLLLGQAGEAVRMRTSKAKVQPSATRADPPCEKGARDVREHSDLPLDMAPVSRSVPVDETVVEGFSHLDDSVGHALDLGQPLSVEGLVTEDGGGDSSTMDLLRNTIERETQRCRAGRGCISLDFEGTDDIKEGKRGRQRVRARGERTGGLE